MISEKLLTYGTEEGVSDMADYRNSKCRFVSEYANWKIALYSDESRNEAYGIENADYAISRLRRVAQEVRDGVMTVDEGMMLIASL